MLYTFKLRRDLAENWQSKNPILKDGEPGVERDTNRVKFGNGLTAWLDLPYFVNEDAIEGLLDTERAANTATYGRRANVPAGLDVASLAGIVAAKSVYNSVNPNAVYDAVSDSTFIAYLGPERDVYVKQRFESTGIVSEAVKVADYTTISADDDHGAPSIGITADGHLHIAWGSHNSVQPVSRSDAPRDISAWTTTILPDTGTYGFLACRPGTNEVYIVSRAGIDHTGSTFPIHEFAQICKSADGGLTWGAAEPIIDVRAAPETHGDAYVMDFDFDPDGMGRLTWTVARGTQHNDVRTNLYHGVYDPDTETLSSVGGDEAVAVVTWADHPSFLVHTDAPLDSALRHTFDGDTTFITFQGSDDDYYVAKSTGGAWAVTSTGFTARWFGAGAVLYLHPRGGYGLLFSEDDGDGKSRLCGAHSDDGVTWEHTGTVLEDSRGEGVEQLQLVRDAGNNGLFALAQRNLTARVETAPTVWGQFGVDLYGLVRGAPVKVKDSPTAGMVKLRESILSSNTTSVVFDSSLPPGFRHLQVVVSGRSTRADVSDSIRIVLNGDTGANYQRQVLQGIGATASAVEELSLAYFTAGFIPAASAAANHWGIVDLTVYDYDRPFAFKNMMSRATRSYGTATGEFGLQTLAAFWKSTAKVTSIAVSVHPAAQLAAGTVVTLYGIR